jgi:putative membrane protein
MTWMRWICESVNCLLPVAQVGGDLVRARLLNQVGVPGPLAGATVIVDIMAGMLTLVIFAAVGTVLLLLQFGAAHAALELSAGVALLGVILMASYLGLRGGSLYKFARMSERLASGRQWEAIIGGAAALDRQMTALCRDQRAFTIACAWRLLGWVVGAAEVWLALCYLGHPVSVAEALILESLGQTIRSAAFVIPGALGVQETGLILLGSIVGVPAETALALSLIKRVRELALGIPGLLMWQIAEGYRSWNRQVSDA